MHEACHSVCMRRFLVGVTAPAAIPHGVIHSLLRGARDMHMLLEALQAWSDVSKIASIATAQDPGQLERRLAQGK